MLTGTKEMSAAAAKEGDGGMSVHGATARHFSGSAYYEYNNGQMRNGLTNCVFMLRSIAKGDGGFGVVPGSHKSNFAVPPDVRDSPPGGVVAPVVNPAVEAGDLLIFTEATLHATLPWYNGEHETRRLLYRYTPKYLHVDGGTFTTTQPAWVSELTDEQRAVLEPPYVYARPELDNNGDLKAPSGRATPDGRPSPSWRGRPKL
eukprot:SAG22_NODE_393_length_11204_cov_5.356686_6_plen_203_part_00